MQNLSQSIFSVMLILFTLLSTSFALDSREGDSLALVDIAHDANGMYYLGWHADLVLDEWDNIGLNEEGRVDSIRIWDSYMPNGIPKSIGNLQHLRYLRLKECGLDSIPSEFGKLVNLEALYLHNNRLVTLNKCIGNLVNLKDFSIGGNKVSVLPAEIGNLKKLTYLGIHKNQLNELPEEIGNLEKLDLLDARENSISHLPESFGNLDSLKTLWMHDNKISDLPMSITNLNPDDRCTFGGNCLDSLKLENKLLDWLDKYDYLWRRDQDVSIIQSSSTLQGNAPLIRVANKKLYLPQELVEGTVARIFSVDGKLLESYSLQDSNVIDLIDFSSGIYLVKIESMNEKQYLYRVKLY